MRPVGEGLGGRLVKGGSELDAENLRWFRDAWVTLIDVAYIKIALSAPRAGGWQARMYLYGVRLYASTRSTRIASRYSSSTGYRRNRSFLEREQGRKKKKKEALA